MSGMICGGCQHALHWKECGAIGGTASPCPCRNNEGRSTQPAPAPRSGKDMPWNEHNPDWWQAQVESRGDLAWQWLVNEYEVEAAQPQQEGLREALEDALRAEQATSGGNDYRSRGVVDFVMARMAALATAPAGLDVERLARALHAWKSVEHDHAVRDIGSDPSCEEDAGNVAAEYARLAGVTSEGEEG